MRTRVSFLALILPALLWAGSAVALADPPGNNGVVKVNGQSVDDIPNNQPHVGCTFLVEFYNYDRGNLFADVTFALQPPSGTGVLLQDQVFIGEDGPGGGTDLDAAEPYTLQFPAGAERHPIQGYHVKLTVNADGSIGSDVKHKVFWVDCPYPPSKSVTSTENTPAEGVSFRTEPQGGGREIPLAVLILTAVAVLTAIHLTGRPGWRRLRGHSRERQEGGVKE